MTTTDDEPVFVDTNVLIYATESAAPFHQEARTALARLHDRGVELWISRQVLREYLAVRSRPQTFAVALSVAALAADVQSFERTFLVAEEGPGVTTQLLRLMGEAPVGGKQVHDANIVATMTVFGIRRLLTHNTADFARWGNRVAVLSPEAVNPSQ